MYWLRRDKVKRKIYTLFCLIVLMFSTGMELNNHITSPENYKTNSNLVERLGDLPDQH